MPQASYCSACGSRIFVDSQGGDTVDPYLGQVIDNTFVVESVLGTGSMGIVYKARHRALDCYVALKVLRHDFLRDRVILARFQREAQAASSLDHPNVIRILHYGKTHLNAPYIAMECLEGDELSVLVPKAFPMQQKRVCSIVLQTARALSAAHAANIIHRDLKPANIVVVHNSLGEEVVKVLDFGIAKIADVEGEGLTKEGAVCGTPAFMSPEQVLGRVVTPISDLFSLGCVMYFMLTCRLPFQGQSMVDMATAILTTNPQPPSKVRLDTYVDPTLEKICMKALAKEPEDRYQSALEMVQALEGAYRNMPDVDPKVRPRIVVGEADALDDLNGDTRCGIQVYNLEDDDIAGTQLEISAMSEDMSATTASDVGPALSPAILPPQATAGYSSATIGSKLYEATSIQPKWHESDDSGDEVFTRRAREKNKRVMIIVVSIVLGISILGIVTAFIISRSWQAEQEMIQSELEELTAISAENSNKTDAADVFLLATRIADVSVNTSADAWFYGLAYEGLDDGRDAEDAQAGRDAEDAQAGRDAEDAQAGRDTASEDNVKPVKPEHQAKPEKPRQAKASSTKKTRQASSTAKRSAAGSSVNERLSEALRLDMAGEKERACSIYRSILKTPGLSQGDKLKVQAKLRTCSRLPI